VAKNSTVDALAKASKGLQMPSESDAPFKAFLWGAAEGKLTKARVRELAKAEEDTEVEETTLDELFETVPSEDAAAFQKLRGAIDAQLSGVKVFKVGDESERDVYIVGTTSDNQWAGLKTSVVET
jgi:hypothetical protein